MYLRRKRKYMEIKGSLVEVMSKSRIEKGTMYAYKEKGEKEG